MMTLTEHHKVKNLEPALAQANAMLGKANKQAGRLRTRVEKRDREIAILKKKLAKVSND